MGKILHEVSGADLRSEVVFHHMEETIPFSGILHTEICLVCPWAKQVLSAVLYAYFMVYEYIYFCAKVKTEGPLSVRCWLSYLICLVHN